MSGSGLEGPPKTVLEGSRTKRADGRSVGSANEAGRCFAGAEPARPQGGESGREPAQGEGAPPRKTDPGRAQDSRANRRSGEPQPNRQPDRRQRGAQAQTRVSEVKFDPMPPFGNPDAHGRQIGSQHGRILAVYGHRPARIIAGGKHQEPTPGGHLSGECRAFASDRQTVDGKRLERGARPSFDYSRGGRREGGGAEGPCRSVRPLNPDNLQHPMNSRHAFSELEQNQAKGRPLFRRLYPRVLRQLRSRGREHEANRPKLRQPDRSRTQAAKQGQSALKCQGPVSADFLEAKDSAQVALEGHQLPRPSRAQLLRRGPAGCDRAKLGRVPQEAPTAGRRMAQNRVGHHRSMRVELDVLEPNNS